MTRHTAYDNIHSVLEDLLEEYEKMARTGKEEGDEDSEGWGKENVEAITEIIEFIEDRKRATT